MKYVYVLVSTKDDYYYEQAFLSAYSLRLNNPKACVVLLTDNKTYSTLTAQNKRDGILDYVSSAVKVDFEDSVPNIDRSRLLKTSIPHHVVGDFMYIDCDTIVCSDLSGIERFDCDVGCVLDCHTTVDKHIHKRNFLRRDKRLGFTATKTARYNLNSGVILVKDTSFSHELFDKWNELWRYSAKKGEKHDQPALGEANLLLGEKIALLPGEWNCQLPNGGLMYLKDAKILHCFASDLSSSKYVPYYMLAEKSLLNRVKESGIIADGIKEMIANAKFQFGDVHLLADKSVAAILMSPLTVTLVDIYNHCYPLFRTMEAAVIAARFVAKKITGKHR